MNQEDSGQVNCRLLLHLCDRADLKLLFSDVYFNWMNHAAVLMPCLCEDYFLSSACRDEFQKAVEQVPNTKDPQRIIVPVVVTRSLLPLSCLTVLAAADTSECIPCSRSESGAV